MNSVVKEVAMSKLSAIVLKLDSAAKKVVVKAADGSEHALRFVKRTVHGPQDTAAATRDKFHGLKEGSEAAGFHKCAI